ncbi:hypothetical protein BSNK01_04870 [Bacillaceae bacterium]
MGIALDKVVAVKDEKTGIMGPSSNSNEKGESLQAETSKTEKTEEKTASEIKLRLAWRTDGGFPSPFAFSSAGPAGYLRVSFLYDTLAWKDEQGIKPWLAEKWEISEGGSRYSPFVEEVIGNHPDYPNTCLG